MKAFLLSNDLTKPSLEVEVPDFPNDFTIVRHGDRFFLAAGERLEHDGWNYEEQTVFDASDQGK